MDKIILEEIKSQIQIKLAELKKSGGAKTWSKEDKTIVTEMDIFISNLVKKKLEQMKSYKGYCFFSEEEYRTLSIPAIVLDPIDGTIEFARGSDECALSLAILGDRQISSSKNWGWLYNFNNGFEVNSSAIFQKVEKEEQREKKLKGYVSRSEWKEGFFNHLDLSEIELIPMGSIAYKLGLLFQGQVDFIASLRSKKIWDIAAGTVLLSKIGLDLYSNGKRVDCFDLVEYEAPLLWCQSRDLSFLMEKIHR